MKERDLGAVNSDAFPLHILSHDERIRGGAAGAGRRGRVVARSAAGGSASDRRWSPKAPAGADGGQSGGSAAGGAAAASRMGQARGLASPISLDSSFGKDDGVQKGEAIPPMPRQSKATEGREGTVSCPSDWARGR